MKNRLLPLLMVVLASHARGVAAEADPHYGRRIVLPAASSPALRETAAELKRWLEQMTGTGFTLASNGAAGIHLGLVAGDDPRLGKLSREAFRLRPEPPDRLRISSRSDDGLRHGVYAYLEQLGCRWLLPSEHWTVIPRRSSIRLEADRVESPAFRLRDFSGTGGFGGSLPVDPKRELQQRWDIWKKRNRLGGDIRFGGHAGEAFNAAHKAELEAHPEYLAEINGARQKLGVTTKLCVANPAVRRLWIADRMKAFERQYQRDPEAAASYSVSVEPADGGGHCECAECRKLGTVSDRVFGLANDVARELRRGHPDRFVNLYAYNEHAAVPEMTLEPNVFVLIAPYAFQRTGLSGDELLAAWAPKTGNLGVYDYWAITDWANCLPVLKVRDTVPEKLRRWHELGVDSFLGESTFSAAGAGLAWFVAARLMWDPKADEQALMNDFCRHAFGPAREPMQRMLTRWADEFMLTDHELGLAFRDVAAARRLATDESLLRRLDDFAGYIQYLRLWHEYRATRADTAERRAAVCELLRFCWRIYDTAMVHSYRMHMLLCYRYEGKDAELLQQWPLKDAQAANWKSLTPVGRGELAKLLEDGARAYEPLTFETRRFSRELVPLHPPERLETNTVTSPSFSGTHHFEFWTPPGAATLRLEIHVNRRENHPGDRVLVTDAKGAEVFRLAVPADGDWHELRIPVSGGGNFKMTVFDQKIFFRLKAPANLPFVVTGGYMCPDLSPRVYFHVPKGQKQMAIYSEGVLPLALWDERGKPLPHDGAKLFALPVAEGRDGVVWSLAKFKSYTPLRLVNAPSAFAFSPQGVMVARDAR